MRFCPACGHPLPHRAPVACPGCGVQHWRNAKPCAGVLVMRDGHLLLMRRSIEPWSGRWDIPGGFCEPEEHPIEAARREALEETNLEVEITGFVGLWLDLYPNPADTDHPVITLNAYYHGVAHGTAAGAAHPAEGSELAWFAPDDVPGEIAFPHHAPAVLAAWRAAVREGRTVTPLPDDPGTLGGPT